MMLSMLFSAPAFFLLPAYEGAFAFFLAIAAGGLSGGAHSLIVVMAQDLIPMRKGFASGAILGFHLRHGRHRLAGYRLHLRSDRAWR